MDAMVEHVGGIPNFAAQLESLFGKRTAKKKGHWGFGAPAIMVKAEKLEEYMYSNKTYKHI